MNYQEMRQAEAEYRKALAPQFRQRGATKAQLEYRERFIRLDARCSDCQTYTAMPSLRHGFCASCVEKYVRVAGWCDKHGPKFGRCFGCSMEPR